MEQLKSDFAFKTSYFAVSFLKDEITLDTNTKINTQWFEEFFKGADIDKLKDLKISRIDVPYQENTIRMRIRMKTLKRSQKFGGRMIIRKGLHL